MKASQYKTIKLVTTDKLYSFEVCEEPGGVVVWCNGHFYDYYENNNAEDTLKELELKFEFGASPKAIAPLLLK